MENAFGCVSCYANVRNSYHTLQGPHAASIYNILHHRMKSSLQTEASPVGWGSMDVRLPQHPRQNRTGWQGLSPSTASSGAAVGRGPRGPECSGRVRRARRWAWGPESTAYKAGSPGETWVTHLMLLPSCFSLFCFICDLTS